MFQKNALVLALAFSTLLATHATAQKKKLPTVPGKNYITRVAASQVPSLVARRKVKIIKTQQIYKDDDVLIVRVDYEFSGVSSRDTIVRDGSYRCRRRVAGSTSHSRYKVGFSIGDKISFTGHALFVRYTSRRRWTSISNQPVRSDEYAKLRVNQYRADDKQLMAGSERDAKIKAACRYRPPDF